MDQRTRYANVVSRAAKILGSRSRLAACFGVPVEKVEAWLEGRESPPLEIFLASLDVIADGPYSPRGKRVRVAVLDPR